MQDRTIMSFPESTPAISVRAYVVSVGELTVVLHAVILATKTPHIKSSAAFLRTFNSRRIAAIPSGTNRLVLLAKLPLDLNIGFQNSSPDSYLTPTTAPILRSQPHQSNIDELQFRSQPP
jgi:hypothetical protein